MPTPDPSKDKEDDRADRFGSTTEVWVDGKPVGPTFPIPMAQRLKQMFGIKDKTKLPKAD